MIVNGIDGGRVAEGRGVTNVTMSPVARHWLVLPTHASVRQPIRASVGKTGQCRVTGDVITLATPRPFGDATAVCAGYMIMLMISVVVVVAVLYAVFQQHIQTL